jgi:tetratricopeptide (TPR) repeat protein
MAKRDLGGSQRFSLCYRFGAVKDLRSSQRLIALKWIAHTFTDLKQYPEALKAWENVREEFPEDAEAAQGIADVTQKRDQDVTETLAGVRKLMAENQTAQAIPGLTRVLSLDPGNAQAKQLMHQADEKVFMAQNYMTGFECYNRGDYRGAVIAFEVVYRRDPQYRDVARLWSDAKSHYEPLAGMSEELSRLYGRGVSEYLKGHYAQAIEIWQKVLAKSPNHFIVQRNIAEAQARLKDARITPAQVTP